MCLNSATGPFVATRDKKVYKVLNSVNATPYRGVKIKAGSNHWSDFSFGMQASEKGKFDVHKGLHAYTSLKAARYCIYPFPDRKVVVAIVPKGTIYFRNKYELAAERLVYGELTDVGRVRDKKGR